MEIKPIIKNINNTIKKTPSRYYNAAKIGYRKGVSDATKKNHGAMLRTFDISKNISQEVFKKTSINDLPAIVGLIGLCTPLPFASVAMYAIGKIIQYTVNITRKIK